MLKLFFVGLMIITMSQSFAQNTPRDTIHITATPYHEPDVYLVTAKNATFKGGLDSLRSYTKQHLKYPKSALKDKAVGLVLIKFIIEKDGSTSNPKILFGERPDFCTEAIRLIYGMPNWNAAIGADGKEVRSEFTLPLEFCPQGCVRF